MKYFRAISRVNVELASDVSETISPPSGVDVMSVQNSGCIAAGSSTNPCCLGVEPCQGCWSDRDVQQTLAGLCFGFASQRGRGSRSVDRCKVCWKYWKVRPLLSRDEHVDSFHNSGESFIYCLCGLQGHILLHCRYECDHVSMCAAFAWRWLLKHSDIFQSYFKISRILTNMNIYTYICVYVSIYVYMIISLPVSSKIVRCSSRTIHKTQIFVREICRSFQNNAIAQ
jgi:hypothetical protein